MIETVISKIEGYKYCLKDKDNKEYIFNIEFYDISKKPQVGDSLFLSGKILRETPNSVLSFGSLTSQQGRIIESEYDSDIVVLMMNDENYVLKRLYG